MELNIELKNVPQITVDRVTKRVLGYALRYWLVGNDSHDIEAITKAHEILSLIEE